MEIRLPEKIESDNFGRVTKIIHPVHDETIVYYQNGDNATNIISSVQQTCKNNGAQNTDRTKYNYNANGNIIEIRENNRLVVRYGYDPLSRLIREDNVRLGKTYTFDHDANGNILSKNEYKLTFNRYLREYPDDLVTGQGLPQGKESRYSYAANGNRDRLMQFNGEICDYDVLGNPFLYRNRNLEWSNLNNLVKYGNAEFEYDASGSRLSKMHDGTETKFVWAGGQLIAERRKSAYEDIELCQCGNGCPSECNGHDEYLYGNEDAYANASITDITYLQGSDGLTGFVISKNGTSDKTYYYRKNVRGDITHIMDDDGNVKGEYVYDAWGNHIIIQNVDGVASLNPIRYRGYYFDTETNLYYLNSRYYDPQTGRFINSDDVGVFEESHGDINGLNLYAYCSNNPVMFYDPTGRFLKKLFDKTVGAVVGTVVDVVNIVSNAVNDTIDTVCNWVNDNLELVLTIVVITAVIAVTIATAGVGGVVAGMLIGAALGAASGAALDVISQGFANGFDNINWKSVGTAALVGGALGGIGGGVGGKMAAMAGKTAGSVGSKAGNTGKATNVTTRMVRNSELTKEAQAIRAGLPKNAQGHTISNTKAGQQIHAGFRVNSPGKEFRIKGGILDDITENVITELKPNNPRGIYEGVKQLKKYNEALGGNYKMVLVLY